MKQIKKWIKRLFCKHDYWFRSECTWSNSAGRDHELKDIEVICKKCGKIHTIQYKKIIY
jgi:RNase P subunit RPR2